MSTTDLTPRQKAAMLLIGMGVLALVITLGLLLREHGPGNMGTGFLQGAAVGVVACVVVAWRVTRDPEGATAFERAFIQQGDERDDTILTRSLAVLGLLALPLTGAAGIAIGLGTDVWMALGLLLIAQLLVVTVTFVAISRRS